ncbi:MAG: YbdD/YjiX family protein [Candidatus Sericytochromatia bacterium]|nr:YbdD/YjiX family protein [Candidatus Sericytochromatia bacterium]
MTGRLLTGLQAFWGLLNGDADYHRYVAHMQAHHPQVQPQSRQAHYLRKLDQRYTGVNRCC